MIRYEWVWRPSAKTLKEIAGLYQAAGWWEPGDTPQRICRMVMGSHCFLVARSGGRLKGMGRAISDRTNDGYIQDVFVSPALRGRGLGAEIVRRLALRLRIDGRVAHEFKTVEVIIGLTSEIVIVIRHLPTPL